MGDEFRSIAVAANEFRCGSEGQIQNVVQHEDLAIAIESCADADGWSLHFGGNHGGDFAGHAFEDYAGDASAIEGDGIAHELLDSGKRLALDFVSAHHVDGLRGEADVSGDGNFGVNHAANQVGTFFSAFYFYD